MNVPIAISGVSERDIDLLLLEEFSSSGDFRRWFAGQVLGTETDAGRFLHARRSVTQLSGESDLEVAFESLSGGEHHFLIENKVNAGFQPQQAERYRQRGNDYVARGECAAYHTVLVAPERYFGSSETLKGFDARVTYEAIRDWFAAAESLGERRTYKIRLLTSAIEKGTLGYQPEEDAPVTDFWRWYWRMAQEHAPELQMKEPLAKPAMATFIYLRTSLLPKGVDICHKLDKGCVDLQFRGMGDRLDELETLFRGCLSADMRVVQAAKSGSIRVPAPVVLPNTSFEQQAADARVGLDIAKRLLAWFLQHREVWDNRTLPQA